MSVMSIVMVVLFGLFVLVSLPLVVVVAKAAAQRQRDGLERVAHHLFGPGQFDLRSRRGDPTSVGGWSLVGQTAEGEIHVVDNPTTRGGAYTLLILPVGGPTGLYIGRRGWLEAPRHLRKPDSTQPTGRSAIDEVFEIAALDAAGLDRVTGSAAVHDALWRITSIDSLEEFGSSDLAPTLRLYNPIEPDHFLFACLRGSVDTLDPRNVSPVARLLRILADQLPTGARPGV